MTMIERRSLAGRLTKRAFDSLVALVALTILSPIFLAVAIGIRFSSPGPVFFRAQRVGRHGKVFSMLKFRTMHVGSQHASAITAPGDSRVFQLGVWLRRLKIDELPQFVNILRGEMSLVGPRPEDPKIVTRDYTGWMRETLEVTPGVTSPGAVYGYIFGDALLDAADPEGSYARNLLPPKLALERAYIERASFTGDLAYIALTARAILAQALNRTVRLPEAEIQAARAWAPQGPYPSGRE